MSDTVMSASGTLRKHTALFRGGVVEPEWLIERDDITGDVEHLEELAGLANPAVNDVGGFDTNDVINRERCTLTRRERDRVRPSALVGVEGDVSRLAFLPTTTHTVCCM